MVSTRAVRFMTACGEEHVFLHPGSWLHRNPPEWVVYVALRSSGRRPYLTLVSAVEVRGYKRVYVASNVDLKLEDLASNVDLC